MPLQAHLALILAGLRTTIFGALGRLPNHVRILADLHNYISRSIDRLDRLFALWQAGKLATRRPRRQGASKPRQAPASPRIRFSRRRAWLVGLHQPAAAHGSALYNLLLQPDAERFLGEVPQAARILRPLLRLVWDTYPPSIAPSPRPPRERKPRPKPPAPPTRGGKYPRFNARTYSPGKTPPLVFKRP